MFVLYSVNLFKENLILKLGEICRNIYDEAILNLEFQFMFQMIKHKDSI